MSPSSGERRGFTLLEVVIAFTILAVGLTALLQAFSAGVGGVTRSEAHVQVVLAARSLLEGVGPLVPLEPGETQGETEDGLAWELRIEPYQPEAVANPALLPVEALSVSATVTGAWGARLTLATLRLRGRDR